MNGDNRRRGVVIGVIGVLVVAGFLISRMGRGDGPADRLLASGPTTAARVPTTVGRAATTAPAAPAGGLSANPSSTAAPPEGGSSTTAGGGAGASTTAAPGASGSSGGGGSGGGGSATGGAGRTSGIGGGVTGGIPESIETDPGAGSSRGGGSGDGTTTTTVAAADPVTGPQTHSLTQADDGRTITVRVNDLILLRLDQPAGGFWSDPASDGPAVRREAVSVLDGAVTGSFTAASAGTATLTSTSGQTCSTANPPCLAPTKQLRVTITVTP